MHQRRIRKPSISAAIHLLGLSAEIVQDVQRKLELLINLVVIFHGGVLVCGKADDHEGVEGCSERAELLHEEVSVPLRARAAVRGCWQAVCHDGEHDAPAGLHLALQPAAQLLEPRGQGCDATGAVTTKDLGKDLHLCLGTSSFGVDDDEVPTIHWLARAWRVQQKKLAPHPCPSVPFRVRQGHAADLVPTRCWDGLKLPTVILFQHVPV
mmetsp:Transcript_16989/g.35487  ORF Transcript_16989/g.35487 Transcript_16989/m.35487 type:complete len:210 (+) Transcript_16989:622-1251(+)